MSKDTLLDITTSIEKWCKENDIPIFFGSVPDDPNMITVFWKPENTEWEKYLATAKKSEVKIIILHSFTNQIDTDAEEIIDYKEFLDDEELEEYESALKIVKRAKGQILFFELEFIYNGVGYFYSQSADWYDEFVAVQEAFPEEEEYDEDEAEVVEEEVLLPQRKKLDDEKIEELARMVASNENYLNAKNFLQKRAITDNLLKQENFDDHAYNSYYVRLRIDSIYETEIRPKQEEEIKLKVLGLKAKKLTKVAIASQLNISSGMVNKFYYIDNL